MKKKLLIGAHTSATKGSYNALYHGQKMGCRTVQFFTSNQKQWKGRKIEKEEVLQWKKALKETQITDVMSHDSYLINLGSPSKELLVKSRKAFQEEIERCHLLEIPYLNFHPGTATSGEPQECLDRIVESINSFENLLQNSPTRLLLETTAGQGNTVGHQFKHLHHIIKHVHSKIKIGVCIDTCHIFCAGYDIRTKEGWKKVLKDFDESIGLENLYAFHLNDSLKPFGSRVDRHASLGKGHIGLECFQFLVTHPKTKHLPMYLETPDKELYKDELNMLRKFANEPLFENEENKN